MIIADIPVIDKSLPETWEEKHSETPITTTPTVAPSKDLPNPIIELSEDEEIFRNPFLPRRSNTKPFFNCIEDKEGWNIAVWIREQQESKSVIALLKSMEKNSKIADLYVIVDGFLHLKADKTIPNSKH